MFMSLFDKELDMFELDVVCRGKEKTGFKYIKKHGCLHSQVA